MGTSDPSGRRRRDKKKGIPERPKSAAELLREAREKKMATPDPSSLTPKPKDAKLLSESITDEMEKLRSPYFTPPMTLGPGTVTVAGETFPYISGGFHLSRTDDYESESFAKDPPLFPKVFEWSSELSDPLRDLDDMKEKLRGSSDKRPISHEEFIRAMAGGGYVSPAILDEVTKFGDSGKTYLAPERDGKWGLDTDPARMTRPTVVPFPSETTFAAKEEYVPVPKRVLTALLESLGGTFTVTVQELQQATFDESKGDGPKVVDIVRRVDPDLGMLYTLRVRNEYP